MSLWRRRHPEPLTVTHHGRVEITNDIRLAAFRKQITPAALTDTLDSLKEDFLDGRYVQADLLWRATLNKSAELARVHTPSIGCRSLDVLHVASALELQNKRFLTYNLRQQRLARAVGLKVVAP